MRFSCAAIVRVVVSSSVGAAVAVLHRLVKKPFEKSTRINYTVKGGWDDPAVTRLDQPVKPASEEK